MMHPSGASQGAALVVAHDHLLRALYHRALEHHRYRVLCAASGGEVVQLLQVEAEQVVVAIVDLDRAPTNCVSMFDILRDLRPALPIVLCSSASLEEIAERFGARPFDGYLDKPFTLRALLALVTQVRCGPA